MQPKFLTYTLVNILLFVLIVASILITLTVLGAIDTEFFAGKNEQSATDSEASQSVILLQNIDNVTSEVLLNRKQIVVAYSSESAPFSYKNDDDFPSGLEITLFVDLMAEALHFDEKLPFPDYTVLTRPQSDGSCPSASDYTNINSEELRNCDFLKIIWIPVAVSDRDDAALRSSNTEYGYHVDLVIGAISDIPERCGNDDADLDEEVEQKTICSKKPHWHENLGLLVRKDSGIDSFCSSNLATKDIVFMQSTVASTEAGIGQVTETDSFTSEEYRNVTATCPKVIDYGQKLRKRDRGTIIRDVINTKNRIVAHVTDVTILQEYKRRYDKDKELVVIDPIEALLAIDSQAELPTDPIYNSQPYIFLMRKNNTSLRDILNDAMTDKVLDSWHRSVEEHLKQYSEENSQ